MITTRQTRAIHALLETESTSEASRTANIPPRTLRRWMNDDPAFAQALQAAQRAALAHTARRLSALTGKSVTALAKLLDHDRADLRMRAADLLLKHSHDYQMDDIESRIAAIEDELDHDKQAHHSVN